MTKERQIAACVNLIREGYTPADIRDIGYADGAVQEAIKRIQGGDETDTADPRALVERLQELASREAQTMPPQWQDAHDIYYTSANALTAALDRAEIVRSEGWNDAIEAAAKYHDNFLMTQTDVEVEGVVASTEAILALKGSGT